MSQRKIADAILAVKFAQYHSAEMDSGRSHFPFFTEIVFGIIKPVMEINPLRGNLCTITEFVLWNRHRRHIPDNSQRIGARH